LTDRLQQLAFVAEAFANAEMLSHWVRATRLAVAAQQSVFAGFDEDDRDRVVNAKMLQDRGQFLKLIAFACVNEQRCAREAAIAGGVELGKDRNEFDGKIVHAIKAHVLEGVEDGAFSRTGQAGENDKLAGFGSVG